MILKHLDFYLNAHVYHFRDSRDREADAVIEFNDGSWGLVEIKLGGIDIINLASKRLIKLSNDIISDKKPAFLMIITGTELAYKNKDWVYIVPLGCLKP